MPSADPTALSSNRVEELLSALAAPKSRKTPPPPYVAKLRAKVEPAKVRFAARA